MTHRQLETATAALAARLTKGEAMLERLRKARQEESGFTLIELLIVIVILGVLAGVVVFAVGGITDRGNVAACKSDVKTVEVASEAYWAQNKDYAIAMDNAGHTADTLVGAKLLREVHKDGDGGYNVVYTAANGAVTATGLGTDCP
jgi:prepilin-type N-terminal cleavage/methylation domain-containing protein